MHINTCICMHAYKYMHIQCAYSYMHINTCIHGYIAERARNKEWEMSGERARQSARARARARKREKGREKETERERERERERTQTQKSKGTRRRSASPPQPCGLSSGWLIRLSTRHAASVTWICAQAYRYKHTGKAYTYKAYTYKAYTYKAYRYKHTGKAHQAYKPYSQVAKETYYKGKRDLL